MPDGVSQLSSVGCITKALLDALDQIENQVAASQIGPDGKPLGSAIYMHMPTGYPIDPKMFANPWTPAGGDSSSQFSNDGAFSAPAQAASSTPPPGPPGSVYPPPAKPDPQLEASIQAAFFTSKLVDQMLEVTQNGVATAWPDRNVSVEYFTVVQGMQPMDKSTPAQAVLDKIAAAQDLLYIKDANGNRVGYTPLYAQFRRNQQAWTDAIAAQASAYAQAMADPIAGQEWPIVASSYANKVTQALNDFNSMGRQQVQDALDTIATQGESAVTALAALARQLYDAFQVQLAGGISANLPWSYISPMSWWDYTDESFGVQKITGTSEAHDARTNSGTGSFASNWQRQQSQSNSGSGGFDVGIYSASASGSHADASNAFANNANQFNWTTHQDSSSSASVSLEYFIATIERPWFLGDIFNLKGWYLVGQRANSISDGTVANQIGDKCPAILPMLPKGFLIIRNVKITCDDWGDFGSSFSQAAQASQGSGQSSSNSVAVSGGYLFMKGSAQHQDQQSSGAFGSQQTSSSFTFTSDGKKGGTLELLGSQIAGWIGQIQPAAPLMDDPTLPKPTSENSPEAMAGAGATPAAGS
ncbi:hypothetical protein [Mycobacterium sp. 1245852.3]|uniref:hypothetical protein n=1 Tax=Mycobacterium sp. 1245852.3 TaxID=1856860 RepID=UPI000A62D481|nr:hypothetical protein [Mycobacterium sp. 1245852.3]